MTEIPPPKDLNEAIGEAYELLLEKALEEAQKSTAGIHRIIDEIRTDHNKSARKDETADLAGYVKRDLTDAARHKEKTGELSREWLGFDRARVERNFWEKFSSAADKTTTELVKIKLQAEQVGYQTGEIVGLGTLACDNCGEKLHFEKPGRIPPCPKCKHTHFHRHYIE